MGIYFYYYPLDNGKFMPKKYVEKIEEFAGRKGM